jgi:hypothetical protein
MAEAGVGGDPVPALADVERVRQHLDPLAGDARSSDPPQQLLRLAREHRAGDHLDAPDPADHPAMIPEPALPCETQQP